MKQKIILTTVIVLSLTSQFITAGPITDTYTTGDTLTAKKMNNIKSAVNDNDTNITAFFSGDGSAGDLTVSAAVNWNSTPPANPNFANITIDAGQTLTVPAGTTIRCSGTFTNNGTLEVTQGARMSSMSNFAFGATPDIYAAGHPGDSFKAANGGAYYTNGVAVPVFIQGGLGGEGIPQATAISSFNSFRIGGGSGSGWRPGTDGDGGGLVKIYCSGNIVNAGTINANGNGAANLSGGGGGGIVILASLTSVDGTSGVISAIGGNGGNSFSFAGAGGGGGGGIVIFAAPTVVATGTVSVTGGIVGFTTTQVTNLRRYGGGAGGASGGNGGDGSDISSAASGTPSAPGVGQDGYTVQILANPATMMN
jgi:hypothetical protein